MTTASVTTSDGLPPAAPISNRVLAIGQRVGRSLMLPIAVLPAAALLLRLGQDDLLGKDGLIKLLGLSPTTGFGHFIEQVATVLASAGNIFFANLGLIFCVGVAVGFARKSDGSTAVAGLAGWLVFNAVYAGLTGPGLAAANPNASVIVATPDPYVVGGITMGIISALLWQRFHRVKLVSWLAFFSGRRFVPIIAAFTAIFVGLVFAWIWPWIGTNIIAKAGTWAAQHGAIGAGVFGSVNRLLLPLGLHHVLNSILWFTGAGATCGAKAGDLTCYFAGKQGTGTFMAGFFPIMMFGLPAAALAIMHEARPARRALVGGIMLSAALTSFVTGVTEPLEFAFIFVAPALFGVHIVLTGSSLAICALLNVKIGFGFSAGLIDYLINFSKSNTHNPLLVIVLGAIYAVIYYTVFRFLIRRLNIPIMGREPEEDQDEDEAETGAVAAAAPVPA